MSDQEQGAQGAYLSQRHRLENITAKPKANETWAGVCAIIALVVYVVIVVAQYLDYSAYLGQ